MAESNNGNQLNVLDELEKAFRDCMCLFAIDNCVYVRPRASEVQEQTEQSLERFLDAARKVDTYFLHKRILLSQQQPELFLKEESYLISEEIKRKDELIKREHEKIDQWKKVLADISINWTDESIDSRGSEEKTNENKIALDEQSNERQPTEPQSDVPRYRLRSRRVPDVAASQQQQNDLSQNRMDCRQTEEAAALQQQDEINQDQSPEVDELYMQLEDLPQLQMYYRQRSDTAVLQQQDDLSQHEMHQDQSSEVEELFQELSDLSHLQVPDSQTSDVAALQQQSILHRRLMHDRTSPDIVVLEQRESSLPQMLRREMLDEAASQKQSDLTQHQIPDRQSPDSTTQIDLSQHEMRCSQTPEEAVAQLHQEQQDNLPRHRMRSQSFDTDTLQGQKVIQPQPRTRRSQTLDETPLQQLHGDLFEEEMPCPQTSEVRVPQLQLLPQNNIPQHPIRRQSNSAILPQLLRHEMRRQETSEVRVPQLQQQQQGSLHWQQIRSQFDASTSQQQDDPAQHEMRRQQVIEPPAPQLQQQQGNPPRSIPRRSQSFDGGVVQQQQGDKPQRQQRRSLTTEEEALHQQRLEEIVQRNLQTSHRMRLERQMVFQQLYRQQQQLLNRTDSATAYEQMTRIGVQVRQFLQQQSRDQEQQESQEQQPPNLQQQQPRDPREQ